MEPKHHQKSEQHQRDRPEHQTASPDVLDSVHNQPQCAEESDESSECYVRFLLADELPRYEICKTKIALSKEKIGAGLDALERHFHDATPDRLDGLRLDWSDKWLLVRGSNTEPIVRAIAEANTSDEAERLCRESATVLASL